MNPKPVCDAASAVSSDGVVNSIVDSFSGAQLVRALFKRKLFAYVLKFAYLGEVRFSDAESSDSEEVAAACSISRDFARINWIRSSSIPSRFMNLVALFIVVTRLISLIIFTARM